VPPMRAVSWQCAGQQTALPTPARRNLWRQRGYCCLSGALDETQSRDREQELLRTFDQTIKRRKKPKEQCRSENNLKKRNQSYRRLNSIGTCTYLRPMRSKRGLSRPFTTSAAPAAAATPTSSPSFLSLSLALFSPFSIDLCLDLDRSSACSA